MTPTPRGRMFRLIASLFSVRVLAAGLQALVLVFLARFLGPTEFGVFAALVAFGTVSANLLGFGGRAQALRVSATPRPTSYSRTLLAIRLIGAIAAGVLTLAVGALVFDQHILSAFSALVAIVVSTDAVNVFSQHLLLGLHYRRSASIAILFRPMAPIAGLALAYASSSDPIPGLMIGYIASATSSLVIVLRRSSGFEPMRLVLRESRAFWASTSLVSLQQLDVTLVGALGTPSLAGNFGAAQRVTNPLNIATTSILGIITPELSKVTEQKQRDMAFNHARLVILGVAAGFFLAAPLAMWLGPLILGEGYSESRSIFGALCAALGLNALTQAYAAGFYAWSRAHVLARVRLVTVPLYLLAIGSAAFVSSDIILAAALLAGRLLELGVLHWTFTHSGPRNL